MQVFLNDEKTREMLTEVLIDLIRTRKELFAEIFRDAWEEVGLANAIAEGEGEIVQESNTKFGKEYKVDWQIPNTEGVELRTIWEIGLESGYPRLISAF